MPSDLQRVAQGLIDCLDQVPAMMDRLQRLAARCRENAGMISGMGSANPAAGNAAMMLDAAARACEEAVHHAAAAPPKARAWAEQMVTGARSVSGGGSTSRVSGGQPEASEPAPFIESIFKRLPERPENKGPTKGILTSSDGRGMTHLVSGARGPGAGSPRLAGWAAKLSVAQDHVEGHAAALLRRAGAPKEATLYLNNKPCAGEAGCDETLEDQLPRGTKLTVYWPGDHKVYRGNGKGMA